jgi:hypothetical protein
MFYSEKRREQLIRSFKGNYVQLQSGEIHRMTTYCNQNINQHLGQERISQAKGVKGLQYRDRLSEFTAYRKFASSVY